MVIKAPLKPEIQRIQELIIQKWRKPLNSDQHRPHRRRTDGLNCSDLTVGS